MPLEMKDATKRSLVRRLTEWAALLAMLSLCNLCSPAEAAACDGDGALGKQMTISGACEFISAVNGAYTLQGTTADGREYYVNGNGNYLFYDADCGGDAATYSARWMIAPAKPSTAATTDLAGDGGTCLAHADLVSTARTLPSSATWNLYCAADTLVDTVLSIAPPTCICKLGYSGDNCKIGSAPPADTATTSTASAATTQTPAQTQPDLEWFDRSYLGDNSWGNFGEVSSWLNATQFCENMGGTLATLEDYCTAAQDALFQGRRDLIDNTISWDQWAPYYKDSNEVNRGLFLQVGIWNNNPESTCKTHVQLVGARAVWARNLTATQNAGNWLLCKDLERCTGNNSSCGHVNPSKNWTRLSVAQQEVECGHDVVEGRDCEWEPWKPVASGPVTTRPVTRPVVISPSLPASAVTATATTVATTTMSTAPTTTTTHDCKPDGDTCAHIEATMCIGDSGVSAMVRRACKTLCTPACSAPTTTPASSGNFILMEGSSCSMPEAYIETKEVCNLAAQDLSLDDTIAFSRHEVNDLNDLQDKLSGAISTAGSIRGFPENAPHGCYWKRDAYAHALYFNPNGTRGVESNDRHSICRHNVTSTTTISSSSSTTTPPPTTNGTTMPDASTTLAAKTAAPGQTTTTTPTPSVDSSNKTNSGRTTAVVVAVIVVLLAAAVGGSWYFAGQHCCSTAHGNGGGELDGFRNESIEMMDNPMRAAAAAAATAAATAAVAAAGEDTLVNNPTLASPGPSANGPRGSGVVVESNQQAYFVPMLAEDAVSATGEDTYLAPSTAQAQAYELRQVPGARDHRNHTNQIYAPPLAPPPTTPTAAPMDYSYIDEDDASGGFKGRG